jgi:putative DNA primase/helicase
MYDIFKDAAYFGSITELTSDKFLKANLVGKMVLIDDDMNLEGLKDTSFLKSLATSETPLTVQAKGKQGVQVKLKCRTMCFANGTPKSLYDKTDGWERRLIILSAKPVPKDRITDPFLSEKLLGEKEGIFLWGLKGLHRLMANNFKFTISENAKENIIQMKEDNCNIISFLKDEQLVKFGSELECSTADLYSGYCYWCNLNGVIALKRESFSVWLKQNYHNYNLEYSEKTISHSSQKFARGYKGIDTTFRSVLK